MARLLLTDFDTSVALVVPYSQETDLILADRPEGATRVTVSINGATSQTLLVQETAAQIRRREVICQF